MCSLQIVNSSSFLPEMQQETVLFLSNPLDLARDRSCWPPSLVRRARRAALQPPVVKWGTKVNREMIQWLLRRGRLSRLVVCFCLLANPVRAADEDAETDRALRRTLTAGTIRAFVKGSRIRMRCDAQGPGVMFKARWKRGPLDDRDYSYHTAELEQEKTLRGYPVRGAPGTR